MNKYDFRGRGFSLRRRRRFQHICTAVACGLLAAAVGAGAFTLLYHKSPDLISNYHPKLSESGGGDIGSGVPTAVLEETEPVQQVSPAEDLLSQARLLAAGYDYDRAIELLENSGEYREQEPVRQAIEGYQSDKAALVRFNPQEVTHVFFHSLIVDASRAFDGDHNSAGYNQMMTTKQEFLDIMQSMYDKGYVLVRIRDLAYETVDENGNKKFVYGDIMLPEGKKAFILSQDDVCYYEYMKGDGFATRMIVGEDGYPTCEMELEDGTVSVGGYDLVPLLEKFIQEHPNFSYKGARGILAFTGYNGILGYRTDASYSSSPTYESDRKEAARVAQCLRDHGWELASHSWGHRNLGKISIEHFKSDADKWAQNVESLTGPTDIMIYPFGSDIGSWKPYTDENERFTYLKSKGFRYFCNVDASTPYWIQMGTDHIRQGRRDLDGYRMYHHPDSINDLFDAAEVFDNARPAPVPDM